MRLAMVGCVFGLAGMLAGAAAADPEQVEPKEWSFGEVVTTAVVPEVEPNGRGPGQMIASGDHVNPALLTSGEDDWYFFTANAGETVTLFTGSIGSSEVDTYLELYLGGGTNPVAEDDDDGPGRFSLVDYPVPASGQYRVKVRGFDDSSAGGYHLTLICEIPPAPPEHDRCNDLYAIERCTSGSLEGDLSGACNDYVTVDPSCTGYPATGRDVAYRLDLQSGDVVDLIYTQLEFDTSFCIIRDCEDSPNHCVVGVDGTLAGEPEALNWVVETAGTYWLILDVYGEERGAAWTLDFAVTCGPTPADDTSWGNLKTNYR